MIRTHNNERYLTAVNFSDSSTLRIDLARFGITKAGDFCADDGIFYIPLEKDNATVLKLS